MITGLKCRGTTPQVLHHSALLQVKHYAKPKGTQRCCKQAYLRSLNEQQQGRGALALQIQVRQARGAIYALVQEVSSNAEQFLGDCLVQQGRPKLAVLLQATQKPLMSPQQFSLARCWPVSTPAS